MKLTPKILLYKYYIDPWANFILRKKHRNRVARRIIERFENAIRIKFVRKLKNIEIHYYKRKTKRNLRNFIFRILYKFYGIQKTFNQSINSLLNFWRKSHIYRIKKFVGPKVFKLNYLNFYAIEKRLPFIKSPRYFIRKKLDFKKYKIYYCFSSNQKFNHYIKKLEYNFTKNNLQFGLSSLLLEIIFKANFFPTTRFAYNFIKIGGVLVNDIKTRNPHKSVLLYDIVKVAPNFIKLILKYLKFRFKRKRILINLPNYIDFDYKLLSFCIWRAPTSLERRLSHCFPFFRPRNFDHRPFEIEYNKYKRNIY